MAHRVHSACRVHLQGFFIRIYLCYHQKYPNISNVTSDRGMGHLLSLSGVSYMQWFEKCMLELTHHNMFESTGHRSRFLDLITCYWRAPFFTKGLCKCMYLSSWDEEHFSIMLDTLNDLIIEGAQNLGVMADQGDVFADQATGADAELFRLSCAFIRDLPYEAPDYTLLDPDEAYIIRRALIASQYIDDLPDPHAS